jgi:hypothetical protein
VYKFLAATFLLSSISWAQGRWDLNRAAVRAGDSYLISRVMSSPVSGTTWTFPLREVGNAGVVIGSATSVCIDDRSNSYVITAAHVVQSRRNIVVGESVLGEVLFSDQWTDLALIKLPGISVPCLDIEPSVALPLAFDPHLVHQVWEQSIQVEAFDISRGSMTSARYGTTLAASVYSGLPGHDFTGPLLLSASRGLPAMSGGALIRVEPDRLASRYNLFVPAEFRTPSLIGMILASSPNGDKVYSLSSPIIRARIQAYFSRPNLRLLATNQGDVISYGNIRAQMEQSRVEPRRAIDIGRSRGGDRGLVSQSPRGVLRYRDRRWLHLESVWTEGAALSSDAISALRRNTNLRGIFESTRGLERTDANVAVPVLQGFGRQIFRSMVDDFPEHDNMLLRSPCYRFLSGRRQAGSERVTVVVVVYCEASLVEGSRDFLLAMEGSSASLVVRGRLQFRGTSLDLAIKNSWENGISVRSMSARQAENLFAATTAGDQFSPARSLRRVPFENGEIQFDSEGPLSIIWAEGQSAMEVVAPVYRSPAPDFSLLLSSPEEARRFIDHYLISVYGR